MSAQQIADRLNACKLPAGRPQQAYVCFMYDASTNAEVFVKRRMRRHGQGNRRSLVPGPEGSQLSFEHPWKPARRPVWNAGPKLGRIATRSHQDYTVVAHECKAIAAPDVRGSPFQITYYKKVVDAVRKSRSSGIPIVIIV